MTAKEWQRWKGIMKAYPFEEKRLAKWEPPYIVQPKYDGVRCRAVPTADGNYILLSSEENPIFSVPHILEALNNSNITIELDGELYCHGMSFEEVFSITSRTTNLHPDHKVIRFHIFDTVEDDRQGRRTIRSIQIVDELNNEVFESAPFWLCYSLDCVTRAYDKVVELGYEGIIVRHHAAPYQRKRSIYMMKFKPKKEDTYEIVGVEEEISKDGNPKGSLGALVLKSGDGNIFKVGTGFSAEDRQTLWTARGILAGRRAKVKYQHITAKRGVPRFPVFVDIPLEGEGK